jgi:hypothetical protein
MRWEKTEPDSNWIVGNEETSQPSTAFPKRSAEMGSCRKIAIALIEVNECKRLISSTMISSTMIAVGNFESTQSPMGKSVPFSESTQRISLLCNEHFPFNMMC